MAEPDPLTLYADRILVDGWCLRSSLVRYAQPEAVRSTVLHAQMRRLDAALASGDRRPELLEVVTRFDALAVEMSTWASDRHGHLIPTPSVDALTSWTSAEFERLGVPEETIDPAEWRGMRSTEGRRPAKQKPVPAAPAAAAAADP